MNFRNKDWRNSMRLTVDYNYMMKKFIGNDGFKDSELNEMKEAAADAFDYVADNRGKGMMGWAELPYNQKEIVEDILATAKEVRRKFKYFVVLGIGGSALGPIAVFNALCHLHYNDLPKSRRKGPKFYVEDNVDPVRMRDLLDVINLLGTQNYLNTIIGMVYDFLPFMILPLYTTLEKLDNSYLEAASDLGGNKFTVFSKVTLPLSMPGVISGITMVFMPSMTNYVVSDTLGNFNITILGKLINEYFTTYDNWHMGSMISIILLVIIFLTLLATGGFKDSKNEARGANLW